MSQYKVEDLAAEIFEGLNSPTNISIAFISFWIRANIGDINNLLLTDFTIDDTTLEFSSARGISFNYDVGAVFEKSFTIYFYQKLIRDNITISWGGQAISVESDGGKVNMSGPHVIGKLFLDLMKETKQELLQLINGYRLGTSNPAAVAGTDNISLSDLGYTSRYNNTMGFYERQRL